LRHAIDVHLVERRELRASLFDCGPCLQAADVDPPIAVACIVRPLAIGEGERNVKADVGRAEREARLKDSDNREIAARQASDASDDARVAAIQLAPETVSEHDCLVVSDRSFALHEQTTVRDGCPQQMQQRWRADDPAHARRRASRVDRAVRVVVHRLIVERRDVSSAILVVGRRTDDADA
jgi:hypothetical protein